MSVYFCHSCNQYRDCDQHGSFVDPLDGEEMCENCSINMSEANYERHCENFHDGTYLKWGK